MDDQCQATYTYLQWCRDLTFFLHLTRQQELVELDPVVAGRLSCPVTLWRESDSYKFPAF